MNPRYQLMCAWSAIVFIVLFAAGFGLLCGFIPPTSPLMSAGEVARLYRDHAFTLRLGIAITMTCCAFIVPFAAVMLIQMLRIGAEVAVLAYTQFGCHILGTLLFLVPTMAWTTAAFRPERNQDLILLMNDFGWFSFMMPFMFIVIQLVAVGLAILSDQHSPPVFPRWLGFVNFWCALILVPGGLVTFFKSGLFAWNGLIVFWIGAIAYFTWYVLMFLYVVKAVNQEALVSTSASSSIVLMNAAT